MSDTEQIVEFVLVCFDGHRAAAKHRRALGKQLKDDGAEVLDEVVLSISPKRKVRDYDPRRTIAGALTPALTWGVFGLLASDGSWASLVLWGLIGGIGGGVCAYYLEHTVSKTSLTRVGKQLPADSSAVGFFVRSGDAETILRSTVPYSPAAASVAAIGEDLSARVWPPDSPTSSFDTPTLVSMVLLRFKGRDVAQGVWAKATGGKVDKNAAIQTELIIAVGLDGKLHVDSPSQGIRAMAKGDIVAWGLFGVVFGFIAGWAGDGTLFGALGRGVLTGIVWGIFGLGAGALYGMWAGRGVSARRLKGLEPLLPPDSSLLVAWADGAVTEAAIAAWSPLEPERLVLRFNTVEHGAVLDAVQN
jgi:uncharacterized membrane protein